MPGSVVTPIISTGADTSSLEELSLEYHVISLSVYFEYNKIPVLELTIEDGTVGEGESGFANSDSASFDPGMGIGLTLRYEEAGAEVDDLIFDGIITKHNIKAGPQGSYLCIEAKNVAVKMTYPRRSVVYTDATAGADADLIETIFGNYGLTVTKGSGLPTYEHKEIVQYYCSDWDFVISRAEAAGMLVNIKKESAVSLELMSNTNAATTEHEITYNVTNVYDFDMEICTDEQYDAVTAAAWDITKLSNSDPIAEGTEPSAYTHGDLDGATLAQAGAAEGLEMTYNLMSGVPMEADELTMWADSRLVRSRLAMIRGYIRIDGDATYLVGDLLSLTGVGTHFDGTAVLITGVRHEVTGDGWFTDVQFGLPKDFFSKREDIVDPPAAGLLPGVNGLQVGVVEKLDDTADPLKQNRIQVKIPAIGTEDNIVWARFASIYANKNESIQSGIVFRPEVGDEVILGFLNDDPRQAVILGSLYSSTNKMPVTLDDKNLLKTITTKAGLAINFDDENTVLELKTSENTLIKLDTTTKVIEIQSEGGSLITLDDDMGEISLSEATNGNMIILDADGISFITEGDFNVSAASITLEADSVESI